jgi:integrase
MPIRKRGKTWHIDITVPGGPRTRFTAGRGTTREQALELEAKHRADAHAGRAGRAASHTVSEAFTRWLNGEAKGLAFYRDIANKVAAWQPFLKNRWLKQAAEVADDGKAAWREAGLSVITINRRVAALRRVVNLALEWGWLDRSIKIKMAGREEPRTVRLTPAQMRAFLAAFDDAEARDLVLLDALTGLRPGELQRLTEDLRGVDGGWKLARRRLVLMATKTGRERSVPLTPAAAAVAKRALPIDVTPDRMRYAFERARDRAAMPWLQQRDIRRTFGSWIVQRTKNLKIAQDLLGHQSIAVTARHYALLLDEHLEKAVGTLPRFRVGRKRKA